MMIRSIRSTRDQELLPELQVLLDAGRRLVALPGDHGLRDRGVLLEGRPGPSGGLPHDAEDDAVKLLAQVLHDAVHLGIAQERAEEAVEARVKAGEPGLVPL